MRSRSLCAAAAHQIDAGIVKLLSRERPILDMDDSVGKFEQPRIMSHHQNRTASLSGEAPGRAAQNPRYGGERFVAHATTYAVRTAAAHNYVLLDGKR